MRHWWLAAFMLCACGGPSKSSASMPAQAGPTCARVSDQIIVLRSADAKDAPTDAIDQMRIKLAKLCEDTAWSAEARQCVIDAKTAADTQRCEPLFTEGQRNAWEPAEPAQGAANAAPESAAQPAAVAPPPPPPAPATATPPKPASGAPPRKPASRAKPGGPGAASDPCDGGE